MEMLLGKIQQDQKDWDLRFSPIKVLFMSQQGFHLISYLLMLGRELEVPLDVITKRSPDVLPSKWDYAQLFRKDWLMRMIRTQVIWTRQLYDKWLAGKTFIIGIFFKAA